MFCQGSGVGITAGSFFPAWSMEVQPLWLWCEINSLFPSTWVTSEVRDGASRFPLVPFTLCSVISNEADQSYGYRSPLKSFLYGFRNVAETEVKRVCRVESVSIAWSSVLWLLSDTALPIWIRKDPEDKLKMDEINSLQHYRCKSKVLDLHVEIKHCFHALICS